MDPAEINLRIVPLRNVILHEDDDPARVTRIMAALQMDGVLRHPPIATEAFAEARREPCYIVLDGATRITALRRLGYRDALVQIVDYASSQVALNAWYHLLEGISGEGLLDQIQQIEGVQAQRMDGHHAESALATRAILCMIALRDRSIWGVRAEGDLSAQTEKLNRVVDLYRGYADLFRVVTTDLDLLLNEYPNFCALVVFPSYQPAEVIHLALNNSKVPMGITRHLIGGRTLNVNLDLQMLASDDSLEKKNAWLKQWLSDKVHARKVRFYGEPVFVFED
jgi:hypothetical protein